MRMPPPEVALALLVMALCILAIALLVKMMFELSALEKALLAEEEVMPQDLKSYLADNPQKGPFRPGAYFDEVNGVAYFQSEDVPCVEVTIGPTCALYTSLEKGHVVGVRLSGLDAVGEELRHLRGEVARLRREVP